MTSRLPTAHRRKGPGESWRGAHQESPGEGKEEKAAAKPRKPAVKKTVAAAAAPAETKKPAKTAQSPVEKPAAKAAPAAEAHTPAAKIKKAAVIKKPKAAAKKKEEQKTIPAAAPAPVVAAHAKPAPAAPKTAVPVKPAVVPAPAAPKAPEQKPPEPAAVVPSVEKPAPPAPPRNPVKVQINETTTVREFAEKIGHPAPEVLKKLLLMGTMATINQKLEEEAYALIANEFNRDIEFVPLYSEEIKEDLTDTTAVKVSRAPVVTIMGHVDHGKTSILDAIRKSNVRIRSRRHYAAYGRVSRSRRRERSRSSIRPGHEAFTAMRARGASSPISWFS